MQSKEMPLPHRRRDPFLMLERLYFSSICPLGRMLRDHSTFSSFAKQEEGFFSDTALF